MPSDGSFLQENSMNFKSAVSIFVFVLLLIVAFQNMANISVQFLFWEVRAPQLLILPVVFLLGLLVGMLLSHRQRNSKRLAEETGSGKQEAGS